jgi:hypothetical protein
MRIMMHDVEVLVARDRARRLLARIPPGSPHTAIAIDRVLDDIVPLR